MYQGKNEKRPEGEAATSYPIKMLLNFTRFFHKGIVLSIDNWYSSMGIAKWLLEKGIEFCGTLRLNRKGVHMGWRYRNTGGV